MKCLRQTAEVISRKTNAARVEEAMSGPIRKRRAANPYYEGPPSDHFDGETFFNPGGMLPGNSRRARPIAARRRPREMAAQLAEPARAGSAGSDR